MELEDQEVDSNNKDKSFIDNILCEMKNQFNRTEKKLAPDLITFPTSDEVFNNGEVDVNSMDKTSNIKLDEVEVLSEKSPIELKNEEPVEVEKHIETVNDEETQSNDKDAHEELDEKPRIVLTFRKPSVDDSFKTKPKNAEGTSGTGRRTLRAKLQIVDDDKMILKRSSRRRSRDCNESVLQSAIARKEKSYNEANKPQRLTRQLKATPKILENLANAALKLEKNKPDKPKYAEKHKIVGNDSDESEDNIQSESDLESDKMYKKVKYKHNKSTRNVKRSKNESCRESDSDQSSELNETGVKYNCNTCDGKNKNYKTRSSNEDTSCRRSYRLSSKNKDDSSATDDSGKSMERSMAGDNSFYFTDSECQSTGAELIASRLCLCVQKTQLYVSTMDDDVVFCTAIDNIGDRLVGCSRIVNGNEVSLMRPSTRVPYIILCEVHLNRMIRHNCCPKCGLFCTQGQFVQCEAKHQYHRECQIVVGDNEYCPHCGIATPESDILITMHSSRKPIFLPQQKYQYPSAKMSFHNIKKDDVDMEISKMSPIIASDCVDTDLLKRSTNSEDCDIRLLLDSIRSGQNEKLGITLGRRNIQLNATFEEFQNITLLHYAAEVGNLTAVHLLVMAGADLDVLNREQHTPIVSAILAFKNNVVKYLIKSGSSLDLKGMDGMTALHLAAKAGNLASCKLILEAAGTQNFVNIPDDGGWTPLVWACEHGHFEIAKFLLQKSADPLLRDVEQNIALHWAAFSGSSNITEMLLNYKSDVNAVNAYGDTPLHIGARQNTYDCVLILLARGTNVHIINKAGESALACSQPGSECYNIISLNVYLHSLTLSDEKPTKMILCNDISRGQEKNPIQCINTADIEQKPCDFTYVSTNCITSDDINIDRKVTAMHSCTCTGRCSSFSCICCNNSLQCWYDLEGRLVTHFNYLDPPMIFECNQLCSCNAITCNNRVVQHGLTQRFQLYKTESKGWGIRTIVNIPKGTFVCEYIGEIITDVEADQREDDSYVFDLDSRDTDAFCIDAKRYGNFARFINHSCEANLVPIRVFVEHQDIRFPRIAFFAVRDINAEEELSFDYGERFWLIKYKSFTCSCGAASCKYSKDTISTTVENYNKQLQDI